tara:strand:- start:16115 stop:16294 length:180 start_codon:yes stop_codon:yes gene_type:complete
MAYDGGVVIANKTKLKVFSMEGSAADMQTALRAAIANNDVIISASVTGRRLTVVWYDVA